MVFDSMSLLTSKGQTLKRLKPLVRFFTVPELQIFAVSSFLADPEAVLEQIAEQFGSHPLIVRSSAHDEDGALKANAGEYDSVLNVVATNRTTIRDAIATVIASYERKGGANPADEVIIQKMVLSTSMSGVVFTHELNTGAPYYVINYDDVSGLTNTVTSGAGEYANRTLYIHRGATKAVKSERFKRLIQALQELEAVIGSKFLDVEFAFDEQFVPYLLQVRAITTQPNWNRAVALRIDAALDGIQAFLSTRFGQVSGVYGLTTVLGQMPDWNPAEMIGRAPRALAYSLYRKLITDHSWRIAREMMGYHVPVGHPLMVSLAGQPFIDTRLSFNSFLPAGLSPVLCEKLVNCWVNRLQASPDLHDKIEFDVAITTFTFDIDSKITNLLGPTLSDAERQVYKETLRKQTHTLVADSTEGGISSALAKIEELARRFSSIKMRDRTNDADISILFEMFDDCLRFGTVPFSILARHGFIAKAILLSLNKLGIFNQEDIDRIQSGIRTVASDLVDAVRELQSGKLSRSDFMAEYGHLRPGTYDILSPRYDQMQALGLATESVEDLAPRVCVPFVLSVAQKENIDNLLKKEGFLGMDSRSLMDYIQAGTAGREYGKFVFTRSVSDILEIIAAYGEHHGLSKDEMSHISIDQLLDVTVKSHEGNIEERLRRIAESETERHAISVAIRLPQLLVDGAGVHVVPFQISYPNFVTSKKIVASCVRLIIGEESPKLAGKIVIIENADPGFDWIFSQSIGGLITKYGGANSHMAIRCAEFGIPAAIGCGEQRFERLVTASQIRLDCAAGLIQSL
jgi:phosphoenolpyruvate synthase/pyruvate phosphate dikinase